MGLKDLLTRVISGLTGGTEPPRVPPEPRDEPIPTRSMAELYIRQGHLDRAAAILGGLDGPDALARLRDVHALQARERLERALADAGDPGVTLARDGDLCAIAWVLDEAAAAGARALLPEGELTLRVVRVSAGESRAERSTSDSAVDGLRGAEVVDLAPDARVIVSVGLREGERFVSIAHANA